MRGHVSCFIKNSFLLCVFTFPLPPSLCSSLPPFIVSFLSLPSSSLRPFLSSLPKRAPLKLLGGFNKESPQESREPMEEEEGRETGREEEREGGREKDRGRRRKVRERPRCCLFLPLPPSLPPFLPSSLLPSLPISASYTTFDARLPCP